MKKFSFLVALMSLMLFSVAIQAQSNKCTPAEKEACKKVCSKTTQASLISLPTSAPASCQSQKVNTSPKASCSKATVKTVSTSKKANCNPANCIPEQCPPGCKPINCQPQNCQIKKASKAVALKVAE